MILKTYIAELQKVIDDNPEYAHLKVITSIDDEGNGYNDVYFSSTIGHKFEDENEFIGEDEFDWYEEEYEEKCKVNAICVN